MMVRVSEGRGSDSGSTEGGIVTGARTDNKSKAVVNSPRARLRFRRSASVPVHLPGKGSSL
jgi:hypothetical protein